MQLAAFIFMFCFGFAAATLARARPKQARAEIERVLANVDYILAPLRPRSSVPAIPDEEVSTCGQGHLFSKDQVEEEFPEGTWQRTAYEELSSVFLAREPGAKTFPCVYATQGYKHNQHRYTFLHSDDPSEPRNVRALGRALHAYLSAAKSLGSNTSLVIFCPPPTSSAAPRTLEQYKSSFWNLLRGLRIYDPKPWPPSIPADVMSSKWAFCFDGEPLFPVALTPLHEKRRSRHASNFVIALQPKWVFDRLLETPEKRRAVTENVRKLLIKYDEVDVSPDLTAYGEQGTTEIHQLFLLDDNETPHKYPYMDFDR